MVEQQDNQLQFLLSDLGTRIRDLEEKSNSMKERTLLISQNFIQTKEELEERVLEIEKQNNFIYNELKKISATIQSLVSELNNFARKDEIILVERMLKDFQPLEFVRKKDLEEMKNNKSNPQKENQEQNNFNKRGERNKNQQIQ